MGYIVYNPQSKAAHTYASSTEEAEQMMNDLRTQASTLFPDIVNSETEHKYVLSYAIASWEDYEKILQEPVESWRNQQYKIVQLKRGLKWGM